MIFRRPDAFIIKHIKFFHAIIFLCLAYLLFKTSNLSTFYKHVADVKSIVGESNIPSLFNVYVFVSVILSIILTTIIMLLLIKKEKKFVFYAISVGFFAVILIFYIMAYSNIATMQKVDVSATKYLAYGDFAKIIFYVLSVWVFIFLFKATGFDFKTFTIGENVFGVDLTDADSEEIELNFEIDSNELNTKKKRKIREAKCYYFENRFKINLALTLLVAIIGVSTYKSIINNREVYYSLNQELTSRNYTLKLENLYVTDRDYKGNKVKKSGVFIILTFEIKKNIESDVVFDTSGTSILINDKQYYVNNKNAEYFIDFGNVYREQKLSQEYQKYFLVYEIPYEFSTSEVYILTTGSFNRTDNVYNYYKVKANFQKVSLEETSKSSKLNEDMQVDTYGVKSTFKISDVDVKNKFQLNTTTKINDKDYNLVEYLVPTADDNEEKTIVKITYEEDKNNTTSLLTLLTKYATIEYEKDGKIKESKIYSFINPTLTKENNVYYFQVSRDVLNSLKINIKIKIRNQVYRYNINKGE